MKRMLSLLVICFMLVSGCVHSSSNSQQDTVVESDIILDAETISSEVSMETIEETNSLHLLEEKIYSDLIDNLDSDGYYIQNVKAVYVSKEYLDELSYNSQSNIYFGYSLNEILDQFNGTKYVFTTNELGETIVKEFEEYDDTFERVVKNVAVGSGVILICVTMSVATGGTVSTVFATAATGATKIGTVGGIASGTIAGVMTGIQTGDLDKTFKEALSAGSEGFKWGAITGAISGGSSEFIKLYGKSPIELSVVEASQIQRISKWPAYIVSRLKNTEQYKFFKSIQLSPKWVHGKYALIRKIDLNFVSKLTNGESVTNLERMKMGLSPIEPATGEAYQLHHIGQKVDSLLAILTKEEHQQNYSLLHDKVDEGVHSLLSPGEWAAQRKEFWRSFSEILVPQN